MPDIKSQQRKINVSELPEKIPDFSSTYESKDSLIKKWIMDWILSAVSKKMIKENDIIPNKNDISKHLGVSVGTVQNAIRYVEDEGYLTSKQKLGTMISNFSNPMKNSVKSTSKRDKAIVAVKKYLVQKDFSKNMPVPSTRKMSEIIGISQNTVRLAYEYLSSIAVLRAVKGRGNDSNWYVNSIPTLSKEEVKMSKDITADTLVDKITDSLKKYLSSNYKIGDKIPTHEELASRLDVSIKTIHDCIDNLSKDGIVISRRGRYGSILAKNPFETISANTIESSMFMQASEAAFYSYQKIESELKQLINSEYKAGDKLPSMMELSEKFDVSTNTIRKALKNLSYDGYITFGRGRYGGTFIIEKPADSEKAQYQWLSINPDYI